MLSLHRIDLVHIRRPVMPVDRDDERQANSGFGGGDGDAEEDEQHALQRLWVRAEAPEGDEIQVRGIEHQLDADEDHDGVAPGERADQTDAKQQRAQEEVVVERGHAGEDPSSKLKVQKKSQLQSSKPAPTRAQRGLEFGTSFEL